MAFFKIFKLPQNQQFEYKPRFWEQEKEELEKRMKQYTNPEEVTPEEMKERILMKFRSKAYVRDTEFRSRQVMKSNMILVIVILILIAFTFILMNANMDRILHFLK